MNVLEDIKQLLQNGEKTIQTKNFFFERHLCGVKKEQVKVDLRYTVRNNDSQDIVNFGICSACQTIFYHEAHSDQSL